MGNTVILTKNHPSELVTVGKSEAYQISLLGGPAGDQQVQEQHGWWDEQNQKALWIATTLRSETPLPYEIAKNEYHTQILSRASQGFVHSRSYSFNEGKFVYRNLAHLEPR